MDKNSHIIQPPEDDENFNIFLNYIKQIGGKNRNDQIYISNNKNKYLNKNNNLKTN